MISTEPEGESPEASRGTLEVRYGREARKRDAAVGVALSAGLAFWVLHALRDRVDVTTSVVLLTWAGLFGLILLLRAVTAWRRRILLDDAGLGDRSRRLEWDGVEEVFYLDGGGVEVRGRDRRIVISKDYEPAESARERVRERCGPRIVAELRARLREGPVRLRGSGRKAAAHLGYLIVVLLLSGLSAALVLLFARQPTVRFLADEKGHSSVAVLIVYIVLGLGFLWEFRSKAAWHAGWVRVEDGGLVVHRLDQEQRVAWSEIEDVVWMRNEPVLSLRSKRQVRLPRSLGNVFALRALVGDRLGR